MDPDPYWIRIRIGSGSVLVFSLKCWIRIRMKWMRIRNPVREKSGKMEQPTWRRQVCPTWGGLQEQDGQTLSSDQCYPGTDEVAWAKQWASDHEKSVTGSLYESRVLLSILSKHPLQTDENRTARYRNWASSPIRAEIVVAYQHQAFYFDCKIRNGPTM